MTNYVIIGGSAAGYFAARQIRKNDAEGEITIISAENMAPYFRIRLTEAMGTGEKTENLLLQKPAFYAEQNIKLLLGKTVSSVDYEKQEVVFAEGDRLHYDKLLLATGAHPFIPPYEGGKLEGVTSIRTAEDLDTLRAYYPQIRRVLVVGGGLLGLEAAYALRQQNFEVHVCEFAEYLLIRQLDKETGELVRKSLETKEDLHIHVGASLKAVHGENKVTSVTLTNGEKLDCDAVVFSVGVRSNTALAGETLQKDKGIVVNDRMETSEANVWAAGDVAELNGRTMGLWSAAMEMGKVAGDTMSGKEAHYDSPLLFTNLQIGAVKLFSAGSHDGEMLYKEGTDGSFSKFFFDAEEKMIGAILYQDTKLTGKAKAWIKNRTPKKEVLDAIGE
ncbi:NAD(P)/FAD-dependent oxidoreductase [Murdochiella vaginalis]|uniref:NAD(P)/FAD-dependent oxidoreductase n=1 Tax=Murdochiella vaginalis TaxID=1852373 RepID=UPI0008FE80A4|nr:FAD-dependent oxidoreductase [Murdochiella vaginalis]